MKKNYFINCAIPIEETLNASLYSREIGEICRLLSLNRHLAKRESDQIDYFEAEFITDFRTLFSAYILG